MARCLQTLVLSRTGVMHPIFASIEEYLGRNTTDYYRVLAEVGGGSWQPTRSTRPWIRFCLTAHFRQATTLLRRSQQIQALCDVIEKEIEARKLPERAMWAVLDAAMGFKVRNGTYRKSVDIPVKNALRDLKQLVDAGLLQPQGEKRGRHYVASEMTRKLVKHVAKPERVQDPYQVVGMRIP
jgi:Fic family protein